MKRNILLFSILMLLTSMSTAKTNDADTLSVHALNEVVVTGSNHATGRNLLPYTVSTIHSSRLEASANGQLLSTISGEVPGLFVSQRNIFGFGMSNGGSGNIKIRGVGGSPTNSVLMMVDGQPQFAGLYSHHIADFYGTAYVDRVEILRGPASVLYGSNAMGGVINVITKNTGEDGMKTTLKSQVGSYNTWVSSLTNTVRLGKFSSLVALNYNRTDGVQDDFDFKSGNIYAKVGYDFSRSWSAKADYSLMNYIGNDPVYAKLRDETSTNVYHQNITRGEASVSLENKFGSANGNVRAYYSYGNHYIDDPDHFHSLDDRFGVLLYQNLFPWQGGMATVGFDLDTYTGKIPMSGGHAFGDGSQAAKMQTIDRKSTTEYSPYIVLSQNLFRNRLTLNGGLRMANSDRFATEYIPQAGFTLHLDGEWVVKGALSKGYRNPSFREMYLYMSANRDLEPETMMNYELSAGKSFAGWLNMDATLFFSEGDNMIQALPNTELGHALNVNTGGFINKGVEVSAHSLLTRDLSLQASYSYLYTTLDRLTAAPRSQYFLGMTWQALEKLRLDAQLKYVEGLYVADDMSNQDYLLLNMRATYRPFTCLELFGILDNVTDSDYTINYGYRMPGINGSLGLKLYL